MVRMLKAGGAGEEEYSFNPTAQLALTQGGGEVGDQPSSAAAQRGASRGGETSGSGPERGIPQPTNQKDRHRLHLKWSKWGCKSPLETWGFDEEFPSFLHGKMSEAQWKDAVKQLNRGYLRSIVPKLVWAPLFCLTVFGAVLEAGLNTKYGVPTGVIIGTCFGLGLYCTICLFFYMRYLVRLEAQRLRVVCTHLTSNYGRLKVTFDVDEDDRQISVVVLSHEVGVDIGLRVLGPLHAEADTHIMRVQQKGDKTEVELTERMRPLRDLGPGEIFMVGRGPRSVLETRLNEAATTKASTAPMRGWCGCTEETRGYATGLGWTGKTDQYVGSAARGHDYDSHTGRSKYTGTIMWKNLELSICPICDKAVRPADYDEPLDPNPQFDLSAIRPTKYKQLKTSLAPYYNYGKKKEDINGDIYRYGGNAEDI